jgi:hypothetical protein
MFDMPELRVQPLGIIPSGPTKANVFFVARIILINGFVLVFPLAVESRNMHVAGAWRRSNVGRGGKLGFSTGASLS